MVEQAEREPTMDEIVVALREARRGAGGTPSLTVVGGEDGNHQVADMRLRRNDGNPAQAGNHADRSPGPIDPAALRDQEIERLLAENARLNQRVMFLLNIIEQQRTHDTTPAPANDAVEATRAAVAREVRNALEAELRPLLLAVLRLLEKRQVHATASPVGDEPALFAVSRTAPANRPMKRRTDRPAAPALPSEWLLELIGKLDGQGDEPAHRQAAPESRTLPPRPGLRGKLVRLFGSKPH